MKKILIVLGKLLVLLCLFALGCTGLLYLYFSLGTGGLLSFSITPAAEIFVILTAIVLLTGYLFFAVWLCNLGAAPESKPVSAGKKIFHTLKYLLFCTLLILLFCVKDSVKSEIEKVQARIYYQQADEIITYQNTHDISVAILSTPLNQNSVLIDYQTKKLTFIYSFSYDQCKRYSLKKTQTNPFENLEIQFQTPLSESGKMLTTYYKKSDSTPTPDYRYTAGAVLEMQNGDLYYTDIPDEFLGFDSMGYLYSTMQEALTCADEKIVYGHNRFPDFVPDTESNTFYIDYDTHILYFLYGDSETAFCNKVQLQPAENFPETFYIRKKFEMQGGILYAYCHNEVTSSQGNRIHGLLLQTKNGLFQIEQVMDIYL